MDWLTIRMDVYYEESEDDLQDAKKKLSHLFGSRLTNDRCLRNILVDWLKSPRWATRLGAVRTLLQWPGDIPKEIMQSILEALQDNRGLDGYPAHLSAGSYLINRAPPHSNEAIQLGLEALEYGILPWEYFDESRVARNQAALRLGSLNPVRYDPIVYDKLLDLMNKDKASDVRSIVYITLVKLVGIRDILIKCFSRRGNLPAR